MAVSSPLASSFNGCTLLSDDSGMIKFRKVQCSLQLSETKLVVSKLKANTTSLEVDLEAVIGCQYVKTTKGTSVSPNYTVTIYAYEIYHGCCSNAKKDGNMRRKSVCELNFRTDEALCCRWVNAINCLSRDGGALSWAEDGGSIAAPPERKFLCFVNPVGGKREGMKIWTKTVRPMLEEANIRIQLIVTEYADHAKAVVADLDLSMFSVILTVGGDGLLYEVVNGIAAREGGEALLQSLTVMPIPGGTGNGLVKSILYECHEFYSAMNATFVAIKGVSQPMDLSRVRTSDGKISYAFLILAWGLISDIDILSETMRCLGEPRLYIAALYFIMRKRRYNGRLRLKLIHGDRESANSISAEGNPLICSGRDESVTVRKRSGSAAQSAGASMDNPVQSTSDADSGQNKLKTSDEKVEGGVGTAAATYKSSSSSSELEWLTIEGAFVLVWVVQTSHCASSMRSGPGASLADGVFTIFVVRDMTRFQLIELLIAADDGGHIDHPAVETYKCTEYSLEPLTEQGIFSLDGEVVPYGLLQATVMPSAANVMKLRT